MPLLIRAKAIDQGATRFRPTHRFDKPLATVVVGVAAVLFGATALATDNVDTRLPHWHFKTMTYRLNSALPSSWKRSITSAGQTWTGNTVQAYRQGDETGSTDPGGADQIIWEGDIPSSWQDGCPPSRTLACTRWIFQQEAFGSWHMVDADMVFNRDQALGTSELACPGEGLPGLLADVESVALHEFGHMNGLGHTSDDRAVMYAVLDDCQRRLTSHDISSMNRPYDNH